MKRTWLSVPVWLILGASLSASDLSSQNSARVDSTGYVNANAILMFASNVGLIGNDFSNVFGYGTGTFYPYTSVELIRNGTQISSPLYSAGLWLGGVAEGETRVTIAEFASEFWLGPMVAGTYLPGADTNPAYRTFKLFADSLASNPNQDYSEWPVSLGAPTDLMGNPDLRGSQTLWAVYSDANPSLHALSAGSTLPLGVEIHQTTWASGASGQERIIYIEYELFNKGLNTIHDCYVGLFYDPDIGGASDDLTGSDTLGQIFYGYNYDNDDLAYGSTPPALGIKLLRGPAIPSPGDTAWYFGEPRADYRNLKLNSYIAYLNGDDPQSASESYNLLKGLKRNGTPLANGTSFSYPGDPVTAIGDIDPTPGNPHGIGGVGPFEFAPGDSQSVLVKIGIGQGTDRLSAITDLRAILSGPDSITTDVPTDKTELLPLSFTLSQNYPNPFNPTTKIRYSLSYRAKILIEVFDLMGQKVATLVDDMQSAGEHTTTWDGLVGNGKPAASGVYLYRLSTGRQSSARKMVLLR